MPAGGGHLTLCLSKIVFTDPQRISTNGCLEFTVQLWKLCTVIDAGCDASTVHIQMSCLGNLQRHHWQLCPPRCVFGLLMLSCCRPIMMGGMLLIFFWGSTSHPQSSTQACSLLVPWQYFQISVVWLAKQDAPCIIMQPEGLSAATHPCIITIPSAVCDHGALEARSIL